MSENQSFPTADRLGGLYASVTMPRWQWRELMTQCRSCTQRHHELAITSSIYATRFKREELIEKGACQLSCNGGDVVLAIPFAVLFRIADPAHLFHEMTAIWDGRMIWPTPSAYRTFRASARFGRSTCRRTARAPTRGTRRASPGAATVASRWKKKQEDAAMSDEERRKAVRDGALLTVLRNFGIGSPCVLAELLARRQQKRLDDTRGEVSTCELEMIEMLRQYDIDFPDDLHSILFDHRAADLALRAAHKRLGKRLQAVAVERDELKVAFKVVLSSAEEQAKRAAKAEGELRRLKTELAMLRGEGGTKLAKLTHHQGGAKVEIDNSFWDDG